MFRTPAKTTAKSNFEDLLCSPGKSLSSPSPPPPQAAQPTNVRRSIDEWEVVGSGYSSLVAEARAYHNKAKQHLAASKNLKAEIKAGVATAVDRLFALVKEAEKRIQEKSTTSTGTPPPPPEKRDVASQSASPTTTRQDEATQAKLIATLEDHTRLLVENSDKLEELRTLMEKPVVREVRTFAGTVAGRSGRSTHERSALHSVVITSKDESETGDQVLSRIRQAVNAKDGGVNVDRVRKIKDRRVVVGCRTEKEKEEVKRRLGKAEVLQVEDIQNKNPLVILRHVLGFHTDDEILGALRKQNPQIFRGLEVGDAGVEVRFRKKTRNPHEVHMVLRVAPKLWRRLTDAEAVHIDLQRVRVEDHSPLVQCSLCLGYGHGRRFCQQTVEKCSHCSGPHKKADCPAWRDGTSMPTCCNCTQAKSGNANHNAFSDDCPIRRKWDAIARAAVAYC